MITTKKLDNVKVNAWDTTLSFLLVFLPHHFCWYFGFDLKIEMRSYKGRCIANLPEGKHNKRVFSQQMERSVRRGKGVWWKSFRSNARTHSWINRFKTANMLKLQNRLIVWSTSHSREMWRINECEFEERVHNLDV